MSKAGGVPHFIRPDRMVTHFHIRAGDRIADVGSGAGHFLPVLGRAVGGDGRVYALEIQEGLVDLIGKKIASEKLKNVDALWCDVEGAEGTGLAGGTLDTVVLVNSLFQMVHKEEALKEIYRILRKGGRLFVIDWLGSFGGLGPHPEAVLTPETARGLVENAGFFLERDFPASVHHYGFAFRKT